MTRFLLSTAAALALLAPTLLAPAAAEAATHHRARHAMSHAGKPSARAASRTRDGGSAAVDQLNQQSLDRARGAAGAPVAQ